jgi:CheY-like chemotaxis protein
MGCAILIVDDDTTITRSVKLNLEAIGAYEVRQENHAPAAVHTALEFLPDPMLSDVMMPEMDGGEVADRLMEVPLLKHTPIVFLTAIVSNEETHGSEAFIGGHDYLAKPVDLNILIQVIKGYLNGG